LPEQDENTTLILKEMSQAAQRADTVIRNLLDFSAPTKLELQPESLNAVIENAVRRIRQDVQGPFQIVKELQPNLPKVRLDAAKLVEVFIHLMTNSIHAMEYGGTIFVRTYSRQLTGVGSNIAGDPSSSFRVGEMIVIAEVEDTGPGIPEDKMTRIFEPFFTTKPTGKGTGLGLSVVKTIIDLHGGTVDLQNRPERGLRVTITLRSVAP
jgi:signal transduction histidine kinase